MKAEEVEVSALEVILDALECRIAFGLKFEDSPMNAIKAMAVYESLKERARKDGLLPSEDEPTVVNRAQA